MSIEVLMPSVAVAGPCDGRPVEPKWHRRKGLRRLPKTLLFIAAFVLTACTSKLTDDNLKKIQSGMTTDQVKAILGSPTDVQSADMLGFKSTAFTYHTKTADVKITFLNDKVMSTEGSFQ